MWDELAVDVDDGLREELEAGFLVGVDSICAKVHGRNGVMALLGVRRDLSFARSVSDGKDTAAS